MNSHEAVFPVAVCEIPVLLVQVTQVMDVVTALHKQIDDVPETYGLRVEKRRKGT